MSERESTQGLTDVNIEFRPRRHVPNPGMFAGQPAHGSVGETITNGAAHDTESLDVFCDFWKGSEEQGYVRQSSRRNDPGRSFWAS